MTSIVPFLKGFSYITWNFTEASHGKGAPDGVRGALKNLADRIVARGTDIPDMRALITNLKQHSGVRRSQKRRFSKALNWFLPHSNLCLAQ